MNVVFSSYHSFYIQLTLFCLDFQDNFRQTFSPQVRQFVGCEWLKTLKAFDSTVGAPFCG